VVNAGRGLVRDQSAIPAHGFPGRLRQKNLMQINDANKLRHIARKKTKNEDDEEMMPEFFGKEKHLSK
jgi:hypothetical protein